MRNGLGYFVLAVSVATIGRTANAQRSLAVQPMIGYYQPFGDYEPTDILSTALPASPRDLHGVAWGGDVQITLGRRFGIDAVVQTTTHTLPGCLCPDGPTGTSPIHVDIAAITGQYDLSLHPTRYHLWASAGPALIRHSGRGYEPDSPESFGAAFGLQLGVPLVPHWELVAGATGLGYWFDFAFPAEHGPQIDALLSIGVRWRM